MAEICCLGAHFFSPFSFVRFGSFVFFFLHFFLLLSFFFYLCVVCLVMSCRSRRRFLWNAHLSGLAMIVRVGDDVVELGMRALTRGDWLVPSECGVLNYWPVSGSFLGPFLFSLFVSAALC